jgi:hypothetical protein
LAVTEEQLQDAATESGVLQVPDDFLTEEFRAERERLIPDKCIFVPEGQIKLFQCSFSFKLRM